MGNSLFRLKICGITDDAVLPAIAAAGGDAIGLNFYPQSVRFIEPSQAGQIAAAAEQLGLIRVGVFVNANNDQIEQTAERSLLQVIQLHGHESIEQARQLVDKGYQVLRAVRLPLHGLTPQSIEEAVRGWEDAGCWVLLDADVGAAHGGQGKALDWQVIAQWQAGRLAEDSRPVVLAGGLNPTNVTEAIRCTGALAVDVASGVEAVRGVKSADLIEQFIEAARVAWSESSRS